MAQSDNNKKLWRFYTTHRQGLYSYALAITRNNGLAEEAVHNVIAEVARNCCQVRNLKAYIFQAVRNVAIRQTRTAQRAQQLDMKLAETIYLTPQESAPDQCILKQEEQVMLARALEQITSQQKEVIILRTYSGLRFRQIAEVLAEPIDTIMSRYRRGIKALAGLMKENKNV